jgi:hypothetical protein
MAFITTSDASPGSYATGTYHRGSFAIMVLMLSPYISWILKLCQPPISLLAEMECRFKFHMTYHTTASSR